MDEVVAAVAAADPTDRNLGRAANRTGAAVARALDRLTVRYARKLAARDEVTLSRLAPAPDGSNFENGFGDERERRYGATFTVAQPGPGIANCSFLPPIETT